MCFRRKKKGKSKVLYGGICSHDSEGEQRSLHFLYIHWSNVNSYSSAPESDKQNPLDTDIPFLFRYKHITSLKNLPLPAPSESLPYWFQGSFAAKFIFQLLVGLLSCLHSLIAVN